MITEILGDVLFNVATEASNDHLECLLKTRFKSDLVPQLLQCLRDKNVLNSANAIKITQSLSEVNVVDAAEIMDRLETMTAKQLTPDNAVSVLKLLIFYTGPDKKAFTHEDVIKLLNSVRSPELLAKIADHHESATMIKALLSLESTEVLDEAMMGTLLTSKDFQEGILILKEYKQLNKATIQSLMTSSNWLTMALALKCQELLNDAVLAAVLTSPDFLKVLEILQAQKQLDSGKISLLIQHPDYIKICLQVKKWIPVQPENLTLMKDVLSTNVQHVTTLLTMMDKVKFFEQDKKIVSESLSQIARHKNIRELLTTISHVEQTACNTKEVYSSIMTTSTRLERIQKMIGLLSTHSLIYNDDAVANVNAFMQYGDCENGLFEKSFSRLSLLLDNTDDSEKQKKFNEFMIESNFVNHGFISAVRCFFDRYTPSSTPGKALSFNK